ncbi:sigma-70 family RNA polymerase sigma factor [Candidatus Uhrbacteria bacterium]|jgi:RNA polymerase sigma-70 factor, ECF subfamily|nr:sigma-70 family RNA polymerase sigma factor [Candidatus Uhrbacteria bacterium]
MIEEMREQFLLYRLRVHRDADAYKELYEKYELRIVRYVRTRVPQEMIEEIVADTFETMFVYASTKTIRNFNGLIYTMARTTVATYYRTKERRPTVELDLEKFDVESDERPAGELIDINTDMTRVKEVLKNLHVQYRDILIMRYMQEMEIPEIAQALGKTSNNVRVTIHRALASLKTNADIQKHENERD